MLSVSAYLHDYSIMYRDKCGDQLMNGKVK